MDFVFSVFVRNSTFNHGPQTTIYNLRKKLLTEAQKPVPQDALHQLIVMYVKRTKLPDGKWSVDLEKVGDILAADVRERQAKEEAEKKEREKAEKEEQEKAEREERERAEKKEREKAEQEERERKAAAEEAKWEAVERKDRERKKEVAERARQAEEAKKEKKAAKEVEATGRLKPTVAPKTKKPNTAGPSPVKSKAEIGSETDEDDGTLKRKGKAAGQKSKEVDVVGVVKAAAKGGKGKVVAKGTFREKKDEDEEREREEKEAKTKAKGKGKAKEKPAVEEERRVIIRRPKASEDGQSDGGDAGAGAGPGDGDDEGGGDSEDPEEDGDDLYQAGGESDTPLALADKRKVKVSPSAMEKAFFVFEVCSGCATSSTPCTYTMQRCLKTKNGKKIACDACNLSKKKCRGGAATAMAFAQPLGDYANLVYPPLPDGSIKRGINMEGNTEKLATVGDLFTTLVKEQRVLGRMVEETKAGLDRMKTGMDTVPQYYNTVISGYFDIYERRMDQLQEEMRDERVRILGALKDITRRLDTLERPPAGPSTAPVLEEILEQVKSLQTVRPTAFGAPCPNPSLVLRPAEFDIQTPPTVPQLLPETTTTTTHVFDMGAEPSEGPTVVLNNVLDAHGGEKPGSDQGEEETGDVDARDGNDDGDGDAASKRAVEDTGEGNEEDGEGMGIGGREGSVLGNESEMEEESDAAPDPSPPKTRSRTRVKTAGQTSTKAAGQSSTTKRKATDSPDADLDPATKDIGPQKKKAKQ